MKAYIIKTLKTLFVLLPVILMIAMLIMYPAETEQSAEPKNKNESSIGQQTTEDEFEAFEENNSQTQESTGDNTGKTELEDSTGSSEFFSINSTDEFEEFGSEARGSENKHNSKALFILPRERIIVLLVSFSGVIISGLLIRNSRTRKLRFFFMIAGLIYFGFYLGGCPCPIMSFFKVLLVFHGNFHAGTGVIWFLGLAYLTYFMGKSWCGWLCPLGALQEFLYKDGIYTNQTNKKIKRSFRISRVLLLTIMTAILLFTGTIILSQIDPFKPIFNLFYGPVSIITWILLVVLIISSVIIYRPFCRTICPLGLILGLVSRIPGASRIRFGENCTDCIRCDRNCSMGAIDKNENSRNVFHEDCILCGDCMETCKHGAVVLSQGKTKNKNAIPQETKG